MPTVNVITVNNDGHGTTTPSGYNFATIGVPFAVLAIADTDYKFVEWVIISGSVTITNQYSANATATLISGDAVIEATFGLYGHQLPDINNLACGVVRCKLFYDPSITATIPTTVPFTNIGDFVERIDADPGIVDIENVQLEIKEDYSVHSEGFWHKIINGYPKLDVQIMFSIMEGSDEVFLFRGSIYRANTTFGKVYINGTDKVRTLSTQLVSMLTASDNIATSSLNVSNVAHIIYDSGGGKYYLSKFSDVLSMIIALAYGFGVSDCEFTNNSNDIMGKVTGSTYKKWTDLYFIAWSTGITGNADRGFLSNTTDHWSNSFAKTSDLLKHLCSIFGCVASYSFGDDSGIITGTSADKHRITLSSRGQNAQVIPSGKLLISDFTSESPILAKNIRFTLSQDNTKTRSWFNGVGYGNAALPSNATFDIDLTTEFRVTLVGVWNELWNNLYDYSGSGSIYDAIVSVIEYWNYQTKSYSEADTQWYDAGADYYHYRFYNNRFQYTRTYGSLKAIKGNDPPITSIRNLKSLIGHKITDIIDGASVENTYYATGIKKSLIKNTVEITWLQE